MSYEVGETKAQDRYGPNLRREMRLPLFVTIAICISIYLYLFAGIYCCYLLFAPFFVLFGLRWLCVRVWRNPWTHRARGFEAFLFGVCLEKLFIFVFEVRFFPVLSCEAAGVVSCESKITESWIVLCRRPLRLQLQQPLEILKCKLWPSSPRKCLQAILNCGQPNHQLVKNNATREG